MPHLSGRNICFTLSRGAKYHVLYRQNKRQSEVDWESGWSKKKLVTDQRSSGQEQEERVQQNTPQSRSEKPSFKAVGHIVMAMKRFQGACCT